MNTFRLISSLTPRGDQPSAIQNICTGFVKNVQEQVLLGVTGSGKTFTMAHVIARLNRPVLVISHNKTLAAQLYQEFRDFFPDNAVSYFVSYYDYYQPEAYIPQSDTYIEKETDINHEIDKLRLAATTNLLSRPDCIIVASVSSIYNIGSPDQYQNAVIQVYCNKQFNKHSFVKQLVALQYERNDTEFVRGMFRIRGEVMDIYPAYEDTAIRILWSGNTVTHIVRLQPVTGAEEDQLDSVFIYPAKHYMTNSDIDNRILEQIHNDMTKQKEDFLKKSKHVEAQRIEQRVSHDLDMIKETGYVNGIENYSRYFDGRKPGQPPYTLFHYFQKSAQSFYGDPNDWLLIVDESHMTIPQIRGMYNGDRTRKQTLIDYGFRLPAALDNRPMVFHEFLHMLPRVLYVSATPDTWETERSKTASHNSTSSFHKKHNGIIEQVVRPTGLVDPAVIIRSSANQVEDLVGEIKSTIETHERVLVTTLTKRMAEDLTEYLKGIPLRVEYLHSDIKTLDRSDIVSSLRKGTFDVIVGVNLLREGLDLPEVSLVAILDADKEGFLRNTTSLIQTMGRASRNKNSRVILYASHETGSIIRAVEEVNRRRTIQRKYNQTHNIIPQSIEKPVRESVIRQGSLVPIPGDIRTQTDIESLTPQDRSKHMKLLTKRMHQASKNLQFEEAAWYRDELLRLQNI